MIPVSAPPAPDGLLAARGLGELASHTTETIYHAPVSAHGAMLVIIDNAHPESPAGAWLQEALDELAELDAEALESGYDPPSQQAKDHAERILQSIGAFGLPAPSVYPTSDREVAVFFWNNSRRASMLLLCASDGQGACFAFADGRGRRARYEDAGELPDAFVRAQLLHVL